MSKLLKTSIMTIVIYFFVQTLIIISKKWTSLTSIDRVWSIETLLLTALMLCLACDILLDQRFKTFNENTVLGKLFGLEGGLVNKNAYNAYFRGRVHLQKLKKKQEIHDPDQKSDEESFKKFSKKNVSKNLSRYNRGLENRELNLFSTLNYVDAYENSLKLLPGENTLEDKRIIVFSGNSLSVMVNDNIGKCDNGSDLSNGFHEKVKEDVYGSDRNFVKFGGEKLDEYSSLHTEMALLIKSLDEFNRYLCKVGDNFDSKDCTMQEKLVSEKFNHLATHYEVITSKIGKMSELVAFRMLYINGAMCFEQCLAIFLLVEGDYTLKVKYILVTVGLVIILAQLSEDGQLVENGLEDIRNSFYGLSWHILPIRVQKSLLIIVTRSCRPPRIGSLGGLFFINRLNFSTIIRASYSYFNLLNRLNKK
ncbi:hypothetical protein LSTR_LSTR003018 [Laodelphax striatellus]|uniref:Odorant receptor n=1 Tax=Laodelphax striatellus TaxID=195883 RepID=A0A482XSG9_LAOST|nr:hypothetical protein LSTR_LSTR003018 [Laodelphax striatellus]